MKRNRAFNAFTSSFLTLMKTKRFEDISVNDIIQESTFSKASFYSYFDDKYSLAQRVIDDEAQQLEDIYFNLNQNTKNGVLISNEEAMYNILRHIYNHKDIYHIIVNELVPGYNIQRFLNVTNAIYEKYGYWASEYNGLHIDTHFVSFMTSSIFFSLINYWDRNSYSTPCEDLCKQYFASLNLMAMGNSLLQN